MWPGLANKAKEVCSREANHYHHYLTQLLYACICAIQLRGPPLLGSLLTSWL